MNRTCTLQTHFTLNKKEKKKGTLMRKTGSNNTKEDKKLQKRLYLQEDHIHGQKKNVKANK